VKVFFPLNCGDPFGLSITTNFGDPYPGQNIFRSNELLIIRNVVREMNRISLSNPNIPLSTVDDRLLFLKNVATNNLPNTYPNLNTFRETLNRYVYTFPYISFHPGVDINIGSGSQDAGKPVFAVTNGTIINVGNFCRGGTCGSYIFVEHQCGKQRFYALYGHVDSLVRSGEQVIGGQQIASIGHITAFSPHLHFEVTLFSNTRPGVNYIGQITNMPYSRYVLNLVYASAVIYDQILSNSNTFSIPTEYWNLILVDRNNPWSIEIKDTLSVYIPGAITNSIFYKNYGYVDPIKFLPSISDNGKFYNPITNNTCLRIGYIDRKYITFNG
jgi:murein DD-endopeptidase MepM/ murein hydrolase activator NlpD